MDSLASRLRARAHHVAAALLLIGCTSSLAWIAVAPWRLCQVDEPGWISSGYLTYRLYRDLAPPARWEEEYARAKNPVFLELYPPIGKLAVGASVAFHRKPGDAVHYTWKWRDDYEANLAAGNLPPSDLLRPVRLDMVALGVATLALVYVAALQVTGARWLALLAPAVLFLSPIFRMHATQVYMEAPQMFLLAAAVVAFNDYLLKGRRGSFAEALVAMGLACAVKLNSAPLVLATGLFCVLRPAPMATRLRRGLAVAVVPFAVFCAVNPYLWNDPLTRVGAFVSGWSQVKQNQRVDPQLAAEAVSDPVTGLALAARETIARPTLDHRRLRGLARYAWLGALAGALGVAGFLWRYRLQLGGLRQPYGGWALAGLGGVGAGLWVLGVIGLPALVLGAGLFWRLAMRAPEELSLPGREPALFLATGAGLMLVVTGLWLPHDWARYYLPTLVLLPAFYVAGAQFLAVVAATRRPRRA